MSQKEVRMENGELEASVLPQSVALYERNGWTVVDDGDSGESGQEPAVPTHKPKATEPKVVEVQSEEGAQ
jgi:hypothetical protein